MIRTYKRKLILSKEQSDRIGSWIGACRVVYNLGMEIRNKAWKDKRQSLSKYDLMKQLPALKEDVSWIADVPSQSLQAAIDRLDSSYQNFFRNYKKGGGYPRFASKRHYRSILFKQVKVDGQRVMLPKLGLIRMVKDSPVLGVPKTATIIKEPTGYFICIQCNDVPLKFNSENQTIGLDMGIAYFCVDSNGLFTENPKHFACYEKRLRIANRSLARKKRGSASWKKQLNRLARLHHKIACVRKDFLHKVSTHIAKANSLVYMEDLQVAGMSRNKHLSKQILDCGWSMFRTMLEYKTKVELVHPAFTSQTCSECNYVDKESRKSQAIFECTACGHKENADLNAAKNIMRKGIPQERQRKAVA